jgi:hypothetical protein
MSPAAARDLLLLPRPRLCCRYAAPRPQKYDRLKFLQANFRFLVADTVDVAAFSAYSAEADKMFDWDDVVQVRVAYGWVGRGGGGAGHVVFVWGRRVGLACLR